MIDFCTSSAESSFRELDEVFLQTQTRIWIGEVLQTRFNEDLHISDLLQDGEILFEVSKVVWNLLLTKCMELRHLKHKYGPFGSKKSSGRYRPYSNVDSFLKICKILGLSGIDLFSPSDVVEKRDIRKVCICIRALSKKARSKQLSVPDFDMVIYSVAMPTDMVGVIRRSLEASQFTQSSSSSYSHKGSQTKLKQKKLYAPSDRDDDSSSEGSDEAESRYMGENSFPSASKFDYADGVNFDLETSPEAYSIFGQYRRRNGLESDAKCHCTEEFKHRQFKSASLSETVQSFSSQSLENDHELDRMSSCCKSSQKKLYCGVSHENNKERHHCRTRAADISNINPTLENDESVVGDSSRINAGESDYISEYLAFSDLMVHASDGGNRAIPDGENNMFDFFLNVDSEGLNSDKRSFKNGSQRKFSDDEDMEVSSTTSMSSVLGRLLNLEFDDQFDEDDSSSSNVYSSVSNENKAEKQYEDPLIISEPPEMDDFSLETREVAIPDYNQETLCEDDDLLQCGENHISTDFGSHISENHPHMHVKDLNTAHEDDYGVKDNISSATENSGQDKREHGPSIITESILDEKKPTSPRLPPAKHGRRPLLKTVVKGTAIAGVLFLLLHIRKSKGNNAQETKQPARVMKHKGSKSSSGKQQRGSVGKGIYPAEKIKLGN